MTKLRLFFAIELSKEIKHAINKILHDVQSQPGAEKIKWEPTHNMHLTLHFLGSVDEEKIIKLQQQVVLAIKKVPTFTLEFSPTLQWFTEHSYVLHFSIPPHPILIQLVAILKQLADELDILTDNRPYVPHITLGRSPIMSQLQLADKLTKKILKNEVKEITLFKSTLTDTGSIYTVLNQYKLQT